MLKILQKMEELFDWILFIWETGPVELKLKKDREPICSIPNQVPKVHEENFKIGLTFSPNMSPWRI